LRNYVFLTIIKARFQ